MPHPRHVFQQTGTIFELIQDIIRSNVLTKFHEVWKINITFRVVARFYYSLARKAAKPPGSHVFQPTKPILKLVQDILWARELTKFHEDRIIIVAERVLTR